MSFSFFGQVVFTPYHSFSNMVKKHEIMSDSNYIKEVNGGPITEKIINTGTLGIRIEKITENLTSFSLDINYSSCEYSLSYIPNISVNNAVHVLETNASIIRALFNIKIHFANSLKLDGYYYCGFGARIPTKKFNSTNPNFSYEKTPNYWELDPNTSDDIYGETFLSLRFGIGFNYYFTRNLGFMLEAGYGGGGILRSGLNFRFL